MKEEILKLLNDSKESLQAAIDAHGKAHVRLMDKVNNQAVADRKDSEIRDIGLSWQKLNSDRTQLRKIISLISMANTLEK